MPTILLLIGVFCVLVFILAVVKKMLKVAAIAGAFILLGFMGFVMLQDADPATAGKVGTAAEKVGAATGKALQKGAEAAKPIAEKTVKAAKPIAKKAAEAAKPLVEDAAKAAAEKTAEVAGKVAEEVKEQVKEGMKDAIFGSDDDDSAKQAGASEGGAAE